MKSNAHIDEELLLRYADGEVSGKQARQVREHIEACWQCRTAYDELQSLVADCVRYRKNVLTHFLPSPPARWGDIYEGFAEIDASHRRVPHFFENLKNRLRPGIRWVPALATLSALLLLVPLFRDTNSVQAAELLNKAVVASNSKPQKARKLRIRTARLDVVRKVGIAVPTVEPMFRAARYDWENPLSARSFANWRDSLPEKRDEITKDSESIRLKTTTSSSELTEATLTMRAQDLQPVQERFEFRNHEWVEISDLGEEEVLPPATTTSVETVPEVLPHAADKQPEPPATKSDELRVLAALHGIGADLGDPLEITPSGPKVEVSGVGIAPQRQQQIRDTLRAMPGVIVRFSEPAAAAPATDQGPVTSASALPGQYQTMLEKQLGGRQRFEQFSSQVLDLSETMMSRAYALRKLAERFPAGTDLQESDRDTLQRIMREHSNALAQAASDLQMRFAPILGGSSKQASIAPPGNWQSGALALFQSARRTETLLASILGATPDSPDSSRVPADLLASLAQLRSACAAFDNAVR